MHRKQRIRSRSKAREKYSNREEYFDTISDDLKCIQEEISQCEIIFSSIMQTSEDKKGKKIFELFQSLQNIIPHLVSLNAKAAKPHITHIFITHEQINEFLKLLRRVANFLVIINERTDFITAFRVNVDGKQKGFFSTASDLFEVMIDFLQKLLTRTRYMSSLNNINQDNATLPEHVIRPYLLELCFLVQQNDCIAQDVFQNLRSVSSDDAKKHESKIETILKSMVARMEFIEAQIEKLTISKKEYQIYKFALKAQWELLRPDQNANEVRKYYKKIVGVLSPDDTISLYGLRFLLMSLCYRLCLLYPSDQLSDVALKLYWLGQALKWCHSADFLVESSLHEMEKVEREKIGSLYYKALCLNEDFSKYKSYFDIKIAEANKAEIEVKLTYTTSRAHFFRLKRMLSDNKITFNFDYNERVILIDCANHYVAVTKFLRILNQFIEQLEESEQRLLRYAALYDEPIMATPDQTETAEREKEKELDKEVLSEKERKRQIHLLKEAERAEEKKRLSFNAGVKPEKIVEKNKEAEESDPYVLKTDLPGKQAAYYHLSIDEKLAKKISNEKVIDLADKIIRTPKHSYGTQGLIFFKSGKSKERFVKMKIDGQDARLFARVKKLYKDKEGFKHFAVTFDHVENKHKKKS